jgi:hypothetical protein
LHVNIILRRKNAHNANITRKIRYQHDKNFNKDMSSSFAQWLILTYVKIYFCFVLYFCAYLKKTRWTSSWWWGKGRGWAHISWTRFQDFLFAFIILEYKTACLCLSLSLQSMEVTHVFVLPFQTSIKNSANAMQGSGQHSFLSSFFCSQKWQIFDFHTSSKI